MVPPLQDETCFGDRTSTSIAPSTDAETTKRVHRSEPQISFSHIQLYVDHVQDLEVYKELEASLNTFHSCLTGGSKTVPQGGSDRLVSAHRSLAESRLLWQSVVHDATQGDGADQFVPQNRDVVKQLLVGFGMRVTGTHRGDGTVSVLVTSKDPCGVQIVVTAKDDDASTMALSMVTGGVYHHFNAGEYTFSVYLVFLRVH